MADTATARWAAGTTATAARRQCRPQFPTECTNAIKSTPDFKVMEQYAMDDGQIKKNQEFIRELYLAGYEKATAFMALIITAGYAGAFTVWDHVESYLTYCERLLVAGLLTSSLMIFIGWQIRGQWVLGQQQLAISKMVAAGVADFPALIEQFRIDQAKLRGRLQRQLPIVFGATVTLGGIGTLALVIACARHLMIGHT